MNIIDKMGSCVLMFFSTFRTLNKKKEIDLFLYKRGLDIISFHGRIFIKLDLNGMNFIENCLKPNFTEYKIVKESISDKIIKNPYKPGNKFISNVWYNDIFKFEFISENHWKHLEYSCQHAEKYDLIFGVDSIFVDSLEKIEKFI